MHDLVAAQDIVKIATQMAKKNKLKSISKVVVRLGKIVAHGEEIDPENLRFNFELVKRNTIAEKAVLKIQKGRGNELAILSVSGIK
jgi:Zn finger protein HypA/HybF involved in hydrogenase expression